MLILGSFNFLFSFTQWLNVFHIFDPLKCLSQVISKYMERKRKGGVGEKEIV